LRHGPNQFRNIDYLYFLDGGLADNLGVHSLLQAVSSPHGTGAILNDLNLGKIKRIVVIVVNARSDSANPAYQSPSRPGLLGQIGSVASVPIDANTASVSSQMDVLLEQIKQAGKDAPLNAKFGKLRVYGTQINFDQLRATNEHQRELRDSAKAIPTLWTIKQYDLEVIKEVGQVLLHQHPCFQRLLLDLKIDAAFVDPAFAMKGCPQSSDSD
jgi:NTE family protein